MRRAMLALIALALLLGDAGQATADFLYTQASSFPNSVPYSSQRESNVPLNSFVYDNFRLAGSSAITGLTWQGAYFNPSNQSIISGFNIDFWADNAGQPGANLSHLSIAGNAGETFVGTDNAGSRVFNYSAVLPTAFNATAGTTYWMSIQSVGPPFPPQWGWEASRAGLPGDGRAIQDFTAPPPTGRRSVVNDDMTFTLIGNTTAAVPAPASVVLVGIAGLTLAGYSGLRQGKQSVKA